jgi:hypothetical protein
VVGLWHSTTLVPLALLVAIRIAFGLSLAAPWGSFRLWCSGKSRSLVDCGLAVSDGQSARRMVTAELRLQQRWRRGKFSVIVRKR